MISSADFIRPLPFRRWVCWHQPSPVGKGAIARQRHAPATTCRADLMATGGQISCPPAGNFLSVSGQFPLSADSAKAALKPLIQLGERAERYFADGDGGSR